MGIRTSGLIINMLKNKLIATVILLLLAGYLPASGILGPAFGQRPDQGLGQGQGPGHGQGRRHGQQSPADKAHPNIYNAPLPKDVNGYSWQRQDLEGKIVILNFWATWCAPCLRIIPDARDLYESHSRRDLLLLGVNLDTGGNRSLRRWLKLNRHNVTWPQLFNRGGINGTLPRAYEIKDVPAILIFDRQGNLAYRCNSASCTREAVRRLMKNNQ